MRRYVLERGSWVDVPGQIQFPERTFYHDEVDGWLDEFIETGWRLVEENFDLSSDRAFLGSIKFRAMGLGGEAERLMVQIMLGNCTAASDFLRGPEVAAAGPRDVRALDKLHTLAEAADKVPLL